MTIASTPVETCFDFKQNQALNFVFHKLSSAPSTPVAGQPYFNNTSATYHFWNGTEWLTLVKIATDEQASVGTIETVAINPKQLKAGLDTKQDKLNYTAENTTNKVTTLNSSSTDTQYPSAKLVYDKLALKAPLASPALTGTPTAPTATSGDNSTQIATTAFVAGAIATAQVGGLVYIGTWDTTSASDYSALNSYRPIKKGYMFRCTGTGCTIDSVEYNSGDVIIFNRDVSTSTTITTAALDKCDHTQTEDTVLLNATQTLTNKTISAASNTISGITTSNFATGVINTSIGSTPSDTVLLSEKAINTALNLKANSASPTFTGEPKAPTPTTGDDSTKIATTAFVKTAVDTASQGNVKCETYNNSALTPSDGVCTWAVTHTLGTVNVSCNVFEVSTGRKVIMSEEATSSTVYTLSFNANSSVAANTYKCVLMGA